MTAVSAKRALPPNCHHFCRHFILINCIRVFQSRFLQRLFTRINSLKKSTCCNCSLRASLIRCSMHTSQLRWQDKETLHQKGPRIHLQKTVSTSQAPDLRNDMRENKCVAPRFCLRCYGSLPAQQVSLPHLGH